MAHEVAVGERPIELVPDGRYVKGLGSCRAEDVRGEPTALDAELRDVSCGGDLRLGDSVGLLRSDPGNDDPRLPARQFGVVARLFVRPVLVHIAVGGIGREEPSQLCAVFLQLVLADRC